MVVFEIVLVGVSVVSVVIATLTFARASKLYDQIGRLGTYSMSIEEEPSTPRELIRDEVHQMLQAIAQAREARGEPPPDLPELIQSLEATLRIGLSLSRTDACGDRRRSLPCSTPRQRRSYERAGAQAGELLLAPAMRVARASALPGVGTTISLALPGVRASELGAALPATHESQGS